MVGTKHFIRVAETDFVEIFGADLCVKSVVSSLLGGKVDWDA